MSGVFKQSDGTELMVIGGRLFRTTFIVFCLCGETTRHAVTRDITDTVPACILKKYGRG